MLKFLQNVFYLPTYLWISWRVKRLRKQVETLQQKNKELRARLDA